jgi:hypothetical protein
MLKSIAAFLLAALAVPNLMAGVIPPSGLAPGSQYQLVFVTADPHNGTSTSISVYNQFVTSEAQLGVPSGIPSGLTWSAVASTSSVNANANATSGPLPVYNTAGQEVTAAGVGIYTGALDNLVAYDQFGNFASSAQANDVWTGSDFHGLGIPGSTLGGGGSAEVGHLALDGTWLQFARLPLAQEIAFSRPFYALSSPITVPAPEPTTLALTTSALVVIGGLRYLRRRCA